ncbi:hypothetical protein TI39_contig4255g00004 [Zymoseptoria brevis]|uniref:RRM domain-containing protein n=3 Tax=Zymoseptoria TaxID=1047167 RepID=A0A0F4G8V1_9PEZI|nr:hypothetical protein TI39_contig4255g00004 [Zymoseptoria brevis]
MSRSSKVAPEVNRALFVKNLSYNVSTEELFDLFGKFGPIRQIRQGIATNTKGTAFVVYEDVLDAKSACDKLNGFNFQNRYLVVLYHQIDKMAKSQQDMAQRTENLEALKRQHGISPSNNSTNTKRKDSGMSGISAQSIPEATVPMVKDFVQDSKYEKHDTKTERKSSGSSSLTKDESLGVWRRIKGMASTKFGGVSGVNGSLV